MSQQPLDFGRPPALRLLAEPEGPSGFFGLRQLQTYAATALEPYSGAAPDEPLILDFSRIRIWDIAALLWLVVALHHYRQKGTRFRLRLPEGHPSIGGSPDAEACERSADYLRRWRFDAALLNLFPDPNALLVPEQHDYFAGGEPRRFYQERKQQGESGVLQSLISRRLVHIRNLAEPTQPGAATVSDERITDCIVAFQSGRIGDILQVQCRIPKRDADLFAEHILTEALLNVREHPNATIGMIALSIMGGSKELILAVADNGDAIPETIYPSYRGAHGVPELSYDRDRIQAHERAGITDYATQPGVTRKAGAAEEDAGMGLTYIKRDTVDTFKGKLRIITEGVSVSYETPNPDAYVHDSWDHRWRGNLLRIAIPLSKTR